MIETVKNVLKMLNQEYFDSHVDNMIWSKEKEMLTIVMDTKEKYEYTGELARGIFKKLS